MTRNKGVLLRSQATEYRAVEDDSGMYIEAYFAVFNDETELFPGCYERIEAGAFDKTLNRDIRALFNHNPDMVLGRTKANTLELKTDTTGLWGRIRINPSDTDAVNLYARVKRSDIDQCSFGFRIIAEREEQKSDGWHFSIEEVELHEVTVCTFPAYENTTATARTLQIEQLMQRQSDVWRKNMKERLEKC